MIVQPLAKTVLVRVEHLFRYYGSLCAVRDVSFQVQRGEVLGFLGRNGAGKSTTLQMLAGCLAPSSGTIQINGYDLLTEPRRAKSALGYLPEHPPLYREQTVDEYLRYCAELRDVPKQRLASALEETKVRCGITEVHKRFLGTLSKGYQQRVGIAQAILHAPPIVLLDEPTVGLDPVHRHAILALIRELSTEHAILLSTHTLSDVQAVCDRVQILDQGRLVASDTLEGLVGLGQSTALVVGLRRPPPLERLGTLPGVLHIERVEEGRFRLQHAPEENPAERIVEEAVANGWGVYEICAERSSLEEIFVTMTQSPK